MGIVKITDKAQVAMNSDGSFLITQANDGTETLYRANIASVIAALKTGGILNDVPTVTDMKAYVKKIEASENGINVTYGNSDTPVEITISNGLAFSSIVYDEDSGYLHLYDDNEKDVIDPCLIGSTGSKSAFVTVGEGISISTALEALDGDASTDYYVLKDGVYHHYRYVEVTASEDSEEETETSYSWQCIGGTIGILDDISTIKSNIDTINNSINDLGDEITDYGNDVSTINSKVVALETKAEDIHSYSMDLGGEDNNVIYLYEDGDIENPVSALTLPVSSSGSTSGSKITISKIGDYSGGSGTVLYGSSCTLSANIASYVMNDGEIDYTSPTGDVTVQWYVAGGLVATETTAQGDYSFDISKYLNEGKTNKVQMRVTDSIGTISTTAWSILTVTLSITSTFDDTAVYTSDITFRYTPTGNIEKTVYITMDGTTILEKTFASTVSGVAQSLTISASGLSHGTHEIIVWAEAEVNSETITSNKLYFDLMFNAGEDATLISCACDGSNATQYTAYPLTYTVYTPSSQTSAVTLSVYSLDDDGNYTVTDSESTLTVDRTAQTWNYTPSTSGYKKLVLSSGGTEKVIEIYVEELDLNYSEAEGYAFKLSASEFVSNSDIQNWSDNGVSLEFSDDFDWNNGGLKSETDDNGYTRQYICVKAGTRLYINYTPFAIDARTNGKHFKLIYKATNCTDYDAEILSCLYSSSSGDIGLVMNAQSATISGTATSTTVQYVEDEFIEFEFDIYPSTSSSYKYLRTWLNGRPSGVVIYDGSFTQTDPQIITVGSDDCDVYVYLCKIYETNLTDEEHLQNFVMDASNGYEMVERGTRNDIMTSVNGESIIDWEKLYQKNGDARVWLVNLPDGQSTGKKDYKSAECWQYYLNGDSRHTIYAPNVTVAVQGTSSVGYLTAAANQNFDFGTIIASENANGNWWYDNDAGAYVDEEPSNPALDADGNVAKYSLVFPLYTGTNCSEMNDSDGAETYAVSDDSIGVSLLNAKVNVASAENCNNAILSERYNKYQPYRTLFRMNNSNGRDCMELKMGVLFFRDQTGELFADKENYFMYAICNIGSYKTDFVQFHDITNDFECCVEILDNGPDISRMVSTEVNGEYYDIEEKMPNDDSLFEFRYPSSKYYPYTSPTSLHFKAWKRVVEWMVENNPQAATNEPLSEAVTFEAYTFKGARIYQKDTNGEYYFDVDNFEYTTTEPENPYTDSDGNVLKYKYALNDYSNSDKYAAEVLAGTTISDYAGTYTTDSFEYRMAKMLSECEDYLIMDSVMYHYCNLEHYLAVDNVVKNTFPCTEDLMHWGYEKSYDHDTILGIDNTGASKYSYGVETDETIDDVHPFAGYGTDGMGPTWFVFCQNLFDAREKMYTNREALGCWSASEILEEMDEYQRILPERVWIYNFWHHYLRPYEEDSDDTYISKAENGCKDMQRAQFLTYQEPYFSGMYLGSYALSSTNLMTIRSNPPASSTDTYAAVKPTQTINLTAYAKGYYITGAEQNTKFKQKLDKGETVDFDMSSYGSFDNTPLYVYNAGLVQALAGLEALYIGDNGFAAGKRLRSLTVGSLVDGYANTTMESLSISGNTLLETLIAPNLTYIGGKDGSSNSSLDLSNMLLLRYLETRGSTFKSYRFATAGKLEEAYINKPVELHMNNLSKLKYFTIDDFSALTTVEIESCLTDSGNTDELLDSLTIIQNAVAAGTLARIRLIDVYWVFGSTEAEISAATALLDALIKLAGIDENGNDVSSSVLTGYIFIPTLKQSEEEKYLEAWGSDLTLDCTDYVYQYSSKFYSDFDADGNPTGLLGTHYVNQGDGDYAPIDAGEIETPTKDSDDKYDYAFKQWYCVTDGQYYEDSDTATWASHIDSDRVYVADYTATYREFEVSFYNNLVSTTEPICTVTASYGDEIVFDYDTYGYPEYTAAESTLNFYMFKGWDKSTGFITEDLKVSALWETVSGNPNKDATDLGLVDLYRIGSPVYASTIGNYISGGTRFKYVMGNDYDFDNIDSFEPVAVGDEVYFDGDADEPENLPYIVTDDKGNYIRLFAEDAPSFTLAIDFEMTGTDLTRTILSCGDLRIRTYVTTSGSASPQVYWGSVYQSFNFGTQRNMLVIRHEAGSSDINLYLFNTNTYSNGYADELGVYTLTNSSFANSDDPLCLGGYLQSGEFYTASAIGNAVGLVHWCKVWYGDLGETAAKELAAWTRDECELGATEKSSGTYPFQRYALAGEDVDSPQYYGALSLQMITVFSAGHKMNSTGTNSGGWNDCAMRKFLNPADSDCSDGYGRFWNGLPLALRAMIAKVETRASIGDQSTTIKVSQDYIYLASYQENTSSTSLSAPYNDEGSYYNVFKGTADKFKVRFRGFTIPSDATYYVNSIASEELNCEVKLTDATQDPTAAANGNIAVKEGDVWINNNTSLNGVSVQNRGYIYVTNETYEKYALGRNYYATSSEYIIQAEDESGYWLMSTNWWERSASVSGTTSFMSVYYTGYAGSSYTAYNVYGVCPCFSIRKTA